MGKTKFRTYLEANFIPVNEFSHLNIKKKINEEDYDAYIKDEIRIEDHPNLIYVSKNAFKGYQGELYFKGYFPKLSYIGENSFNISDKTNLFLDTEFLYNIKFIHNNFKREGHIRVEDGLRIYYPLIQNDKNNNLLTTVNINQFRKYYLQKDLNLYVTKDVNKNEEYLTQLRDNKKENFDKCSFKSYNSVPSDLSPNEQGASDPSDGRFKQKISEYINSIPGKIEENHALDNYNIVNFHLEIQIRFITNI